MSTLLIFAGLAFLLGVLSSDVRGTNLMHSSAQTPTTCSAVYPTQCPPGYTKKTGVDSSVCVTGPCTGTKCCSTCPIPGCLIVCCDPAALVSCPSDFSGCPDGYSVKESLCLSGPCDAQYCCDAPHCNTHTCSTGRSLKSNAADIVCVGSAGCDDSACCESESCQDWSTTHQCSFGTLKSNLDTILCGTDCSSDFCCDHPHCDSHACSSGRSLKSNAGSIICFGSTGCDDFTCCDPDSCQDWSTNHQCSFGTLKSNLDTILCGADCSTVACCDLPSCSGYTCQTPGHSLKSNAANIICFGSTGCDDFSCCEDGTCTGITCSLQTGLVPYPEPDETFCTAGPCDGGVCCTGVSGTLNPICPDLQPALTAQSGYIGQVPYTGVISQCRRVVNVASPFHIYIAIINLCTVDTGDSLDIQCNGCNGVSFSTVKVSGCPPTVDHVLVPWSSAQLRFHANAVTNGLGFLALWMAVPPTCVGFICPVGQTLKPQPETINCDTTTGCTATTCCI